MRDVMVYITVFSLIIIIIISSSHNANECTIEINIIIMLNKC